MQEYTEAGRKRETYATLRLKVVKALQQGPMHPSFIGRAVFEGRPFKRAQGAALAIQRTLFKMREESLIKQQDRQYVNTVLGNKLAERGEHS